MGWNPADFGFPVLNENGDPLNRDPSSPFSYEIGDPHVFFVCLFC